MIYVVATASVKPDQREAFMEGARICIAETVKEDGCIGYDCHASVTDPTRFVFVEQWNTRDQLMAHGRSDHLRAWRKLSAELVTKPTKVEIIAPEKVDVF
jgi:quinol monooxygenase YgiN